MTKRFRIRGGTQQEREICGSSLRHRHECFVACIWLAAITGKREVINYADDFEIIPLFSSTADTLSDWTLVGPKRVRRRLVDDHDSGMIRRIGRVEGTALLYTSTERF